MFYCPKWTTTVSLQDVVVSIRKALSRRCRKMPYSCFGNAAGVGPAHLQRAILITTVSVSANLAGYLLMRITQQKSLPHRIADTRHAIGFKVISPLTEQAPLKWLCHRRGINCIR
jgi:hypothetical protein